MTGYGKQLQVKKSQIKFLKQRRFHNSNYGNAKNIQ